MASFHPALIISLLFLSAQVTFWEAEKDLSGGSFLPALQEFRGWLQEVAKSTHDGHQFPRVGSVSTDNHSLAFFIPRLTENLLPLCHHMLKCQT